MKESWTITRTVEVSAPVSGSAYCGITPDVSIMLYQYCVSIMVRSLNTDGWIVDARALEAAIKQFEHLESCERNAQALARLVASLCNNCESCKVVQRQRLPREPWSDSTITYEWNRA